MGQVNRIPSGFLDLLGVESLGRNPPLFSDAISPVVNLTEFYAGQTLSAHSVPFAHSTEDAQTVVFVPEGETWFLRGVSALSQAAPGTGVRETWAFMLDNLPRQETPAGTTVEPVIATLELPAALDNTDKLCGSLFLPSPIALISGVALKGRIVARSAGTRTTELTWLFNRYNS